MVSNFAIPQIPRLQDTVCYFWQTDGNPAYQKETIIPKGIVEIIFNFSEHSTILVQLANRQYQLPRCFINGFNTHPIQLQLPDRQTFFGVRFHPTAIGPIFGVMAGEFANRSVDLTLVDASIHSLWQQLIEQKSFDDRVNVIANWLRSRFFSFTGQDILLNHFLNRQHGDIPSVEELAKNSRLFPQASFQKTPGTDGHEHRRSVALQKIPAFS